MYTEITRIMAYSDTLVPDIFIAEYLPSLSGECLKVYIYILFVNKYNKSCGFHEISKKMNIPAEKIKECIVYMENLGILALYKNKIVLKDIKEIEINKMYRVKQASSLEDANLSCERNKKRNDTVLAINNKFFQGFMPPSWYTDLDFWFDKYGFDEDVMYTLFQHCYDHNGMSKNYIKAVAENWYSKKIKNSFDVDNFYVSYQKTNIIKSKISKKLKLGRMLTEYEQNYVDKWVNEYNYDFDIIEIVLKQTTKKTHPNFDYLNNILSAWYDKRLLTKQDILEYIEKNHSFENSAKTYKTKAAYNNFDQRNQNTQKYDDFFDNKN